MMSRLSWAVALGGSADQAWSALLQRADQSEVVSGTDTQRRSLELAVLKRGVSITNQAAQPLFVELAVEGFPVKPPPVRDDRIVLERSWWLPNGQPAAGRSFKTGETLIVRVRATAKQHIKDGLIVDRVPAGMEIENLNLSQGSQASEFNVEGTNLAQAMTNPRIKHTEFRDDRFVVAAELNGETLSVYYVLRVVTPGRFVVPPSFAEDMYRPEVRGFGKAEGDITVVNPK